ncbi:amino acid permease C-terminal domain-containing protein [Methylobacterium flocculans]|uniref:amino acid permease C-terminal domain-containing protein n=1 Tax=Methylobacterium flocculans TaxID=2984843 RepID=UPI003850A6C5
MGERVSIGTLLALVVICAAVPVLRCPFRVPALPAAAGLGILSRLGLMRGLPADTWLRLGAWLALGLVLSADSGRRAARRHRLATPGSVQAPAP